MTRALIAIIILVLVPIITLSNDIDSRELLHKVDVSHPYYGNKIYGGDKVDVFHLKDNSTILVYQARYGGDGEHSENLLKIFKFNNNKGIKLLDQNIDTVEYILENNVLKSIKGKYVATLCDVCDGWEVSDPTDIIFIPIIIDINSLSVKSTLSEKDKKDLLSRLKSQSDINIAEQQSYGNKKYPAYVSNVTKKIKDLLQNN